MDQALNDWQFHNGSHLLFQAQERVDKLIRNYLNSLLQSHASLDQHGKILKAIIDSIGDPLLVYDNTHRIILANRAALSLLGTDPTSIRRDELIAGYQFFKTDGKTPLPSEELPYMEALRTKRRVVAEIVVRGTNMPPGGIWVLATESPIVGDNDDLLGMVLLMHDITERKSLEKQRNVLATLITHDIKNHLAAENMMLQVLGSELGDKLDAPCTELIVDLKAANERYLQVANTLLELYRTDLYEFGSCRVPMHIAELVQSAVALSSMQADSCGVRVETFIMDDLPSINGIPAALRQAIHNIIQNSIEVSPAGHSVRVKVSATPSAVSIAVEDEGRGMSLELVNALFDQSRVAAAIPTTVRSTGFGLYLARLIVEAHGGTLSCESELGKGTTCTIRLPVPQYNFDPRSL